MSISTSNSTSGTTDIFGLPCPQVKAGKNTNGIFDVNCCSTSDTYPACTSAKNDQYSGFSGTVQFQIQIINYSGSQISVQLTGSVPLMPGATVTFDTNPVLVDACLRITNNNCDVGGTCVDPTDNSPVHCEGESSVTMTVTVPAGTPDGDYVVEIQGEENDVIANTTCDITIGNTTGCVSTTCPQDQCCDSTGNCAECQNQKCNPALDQGSQCNNMCCDPDTSKCVPCVVLNCKSDKDCNSKNSGYCCLDSNGNPCTSGSTGCTCLKCSNNTKITCAGGSGYVYNGIANGGSGWISLMNGYSTPVTITAVSSALTGNPCPCFQSATFQSSSMTIQPGASYNFAFTIQDDGTCTVGTCCTLVAQFSLSTGETFSCSVQICAKKADFVLEVSCYGTGSGYGCSCCSSGACGAWGSSANITLAFDGTGPCGWGFLCSGCGCCDLQCCNCSNPLCAPPHDCAFSTGWFGARLRSISFTGKVKIVAVASDGETYSTEITLNPGGVYYFGPAFLFQNFFTGADVHNIVPCCDIYHNTGGTTSQISGTWSITATDESNANNTKTATVSWNSSIITCPVGCDGRCYSGQCPCFNFNGSLPYPRTYCEECPPCTAPCPFL